MWKFTGPQLAPGARDAYHTLGLRAGKKEYPVSISRRQFLQNAAFGTACVAPLCARAAVPDPLWQRVRECSATFEFGAFTWGQVPLSLPQKTSLVDPVLRALGLGGPVAVSALGAADAFTAGPWCATLHYSGGRALVLVAKRGAASMEPVVLRGTAGLVRIASRTIEYGPHQGPLRRESFPGAAYETPKPLWDALAPRITAALVQGGRVR